MAIRIDERARAAIARRRARGQDATILVQLAAIPARGAMQQLTATWAPGTLRRRDLRATTQACAEQRDVTVQLGARVAHYTHWRDLMISAWRLGPIERLRVVDEPRVTLEMLEWERTHPQPGPLVGAGRSAQW